MHSAEILSFTFKRNLSTQLTPLIFSRAEQKESKKVEKAAKAPETEANGDAKAAKNGDSKKEKKEEPKKEEPKKEEANKKEKEEKPKEKEVPKAKEVPKVEEVEEISTPLIARPAQNWSDLFFIIDSLSYNIDACDLILFMTKINPIPGLENKKVNVDVSYLDTSSNTLVISHTDSGIIESLLGEWNCKIMFLQICDFSMRWPRKKRYRKLMGIKLVGGAFVVQKKKFFYKMIHAFVFVTKQPI